MLRRPSEEMLTRMREGLVAGPLRLAVLSGEPGSIKPAEPQADGRTLVLENIAAAQTANLPAS